MRYSIFIIIVLFFSCTNDTKEKDVIKEKCPCDSIGTLSIKGKWVTYGYLGKSQIEISSFPKNDTMEVTRRYTDDKTWHFQEFIVVVKGKLVAPDYALYCDIKDTVGFYKLTYIRNEELFESQGVITNNVLGVDCVFNKDTIHSNNIYILVPKNRFKGIIKLDKRIDITYKGEKRITRASIFIDTENMVKYGNLLDQYKAINKLCH